MKRILLILTVGSMMALTLLPAATPSMAEIDGDVGDDDLGIGDEGLFGDGGLFGDEDEDDNDDEDDHDDDE